MNKRYINNTLDTERRTLHLSDDEKRFAIIDTLTVSGGQTITPVVTIRYQYDNHLGSACLELDQNAAIISYEEYHPFGTTSYRSGRTETEVSLKRYKYCGKERDEEIGLYYYGMRYYAAWICRFVSVDPLQFKYPELTPFQYASNRPITGIDFDGLEFVNIYKVRIEEAKQKVEEAKNMYNELVGSNKENITNRRKREYLKESGLKDAEKKLTEETAYHNEVENYLYTLKTTNEEEYNFFNTLTGKHSNEPIKIEIHLVDINTENRDVGNVKGFAKKETKDENDKIIVYPEASNNTMKILLYKELQADESRVLTGWNYSTFSNELGDIKYFFENVKDKESLEFWKNTASSDSPGYRDPKGAGEFSFRYETERVKDVKKYVQDNKLDYKQYDPVKQIIKQ